MWNKSYSESRVPEVPTMLLELLSHQNFAAKEAYEEAGLIGVVHHKEAGQYQ